MKQTTYSWGHEKPYNDFSSYFKQKFEYRVQKIAIDAGFTCPNRDGTRSTGGCTYCNNKTFNPFYCSPEKTVKQQIDEGIAFFSKKYKSQKYLAYFQAYSNTYAPFESLKRLYEEALAHPQVVGLVIATRPDCVDNQILSYLSELSRKCYLVLEFGIESTLNRTLELINRAHTYEESVWAIEAASRQGIRVGAHLILGLPNETRADMKSHAQKISRLPLHTLKLHQLQIIKGTPIAKQFAENPEAFYYFSPEKYVDLAVDFVELLNPKIIVERFISESPKDMIISPIWHGLKNFEILHRIEKEFFSRKSYQGKFFVV